MFAQPGFPVVLAGPICSGKTTLAWMLAERLGIRVLSAREALQRVNADAEARHRLQAVGRHLEEQTRGTWLADVLREEPDPQVVVDSVRTPAQAAAFKNLGGGCLLVYLDADESERRQRFAARTGTAFEGNDDFATVLRGEEGLKTSAVASRSDLRIDTTSLGPPAVLTEVLKAFRICRGER